MFGWLWFLLIGLVAGWLAGHITRGKGFGLVGDLVVGVVGAFFGGFLFDILGLYATGTIGSVVMATAGAIVFLAVVRFLKR